MATIEARITKVEHDVGTGWYTIHTDSEQVRKLTTKMDQKAQEAAGLRQSGEVALIEYSPKERHDDSSGRTYKNNYYERARTAPPQSTNGGGYGDSSYSSGIETVGGEQPAATAVAGIDAVTPTGRKMDPAEAWRICLATGAKLALMTLPLMPTEQRTFDVQKQIALAWAMWIYSTPHGGASAFDGIGATASGTGPGAYDEPGSGSFYEKPPPSDDIPF